MKVSVFIPCTMKHFKYIKFLVSRYLLGTRKPDEIVLFLSGAQGTILFPVIKGIKTHVTSEIVLAGPARQMALELCSGDVVVYQDADDIPHPQRIEIIERMFQENDIVHLTHQYVFIGKESMPQKVYFERIKTWDGQHIYDHYFPNGDIKECGKISISYGCPPYNQHAGACSIKREILKEVKWRLNNDLVLAPANRSKAEDYEFCMEVAYKYKKSMMIAAKLYAYRTV